MIAVKWAFSKLSKFNYVETFIAVIYINCQFLIIAIANYLYTWNVSDGWGIFLYSSSLSYFAPLVATYDFHQLYGIKWKQALKKTIVATIIFLLLIAFGAIILFGSVYLIDLFFGVDPTYIPDVRHHVGLEPY